MVYRRFEQEHLGKLQAPSDITERIKDSGMHGSVAGVGSVRVWGCGGCGGVRGEGLKLL